MRTHPAAASGALLLVLGAVGCGAQEPSSGGGTAKPVNPNTAEVNPAGDIPDNQAFVAYRPPAGGYSVKVPEGWGRTTSGGAVTFTDKLNSITVESAPARVTPTTADTRRTEVPKLARTVSGFKLERVSNVTRRPGTAVRINYLERSKPDPVTGKAQTDAVERYLFFHKGTDVVLTLKGPKGADNVDPWRIVTDSLAFTS